MKIKNIFEELTRLNLTKSRDRYIVYRRMILAKILTDAGLCISEVARMMGKSHATVIYYRKRFDELISKPDFSLIYNEIIEFN
jgi:predicted transcriptional regulator